MAVKRKNSIEPKWVLVLVFFVAGTFLGGLSTYLYNNAGSPNSIKLHFPKGTFEYTNPTLVTEPASVQQSNTIGKELELKLRGIINTSEKNKVRDVGLYYRDLEPNNWLDIHSTLNFSPGTLLKMPIMITYFRLAQSNPAILNKEVPFLKPYFKTHELFAEQPALEPGKTYSVDDLISKMIVNYDDEAANLLFEHVDKSVLNETFSDLGIDFNEDSATSDFISVRRYSIFFRVLYNATYLSPEYSEKALALLAQNSSHTLLQVQVPKSIPFVSRSGGRLLKDGGVEVYECDIVYYPSHDYLLCAAGQGDTQDSLTTLFAEIGQAVYEDTLYRYPH